MSFMSIIFEVMNGSCNITRYPLKCLSLNSWHIDSFRHIPCSITAISGLNCHAFSFFGKPGPVWTALNHTLGCYIWTCFNTLTPGLIQAVRKKQLDRMWLCTGISLLLYGYRPGQSVRRRSKSCSLHAKKIFWLRVQVFCEWRDKWRTFWPTSPGPGHQPLDGSILLKFYWKLGYNPSLLILWMTCWGFGLKSYDPT